MPIYDFRCTDEKCQHSFERLVKMDVLETNCPLCNEQAEKYLAQKKMSNVIFHFNYMCED